MSSAEEKGFQNGTIGMAASNAPKNDFAPAWLKIPNPNENARPAGSKASHTPDRPRQRREDSSYGRYGNDYPRPLNRQNSCDVYDGTKRHSPSHSSKHRHHSVEDDYYYSYSGYGYPYPYPYNDQYSMPFGSQASTPRREGKFPAPSPARFGQMNGSYQGYNYYYDFFPPGEGFNTYGGGGGGGQGSTKRSLYARDGRGESKESRDSDRSAHDGDEKDRIFNDDFPSLNGADEEGDAKTSKHTSSGGVWDNPPRSRFEEVSDVKNSTSGLYKVVPGKGGNIRKDGRDGVRLNGSVRDVSPLSSVKANGGREGQRQSPTQPMEILSTQLMRPKPSDKKSQFLKALRRESDTTPTPNGLGHHPESNNNLRKGEEEEAEEVVVMNGVHDLQLDLDVDQPSSSSSKILSSSMEKEFSFMRSLGWNPNETDETEEITEDEKREFQRLTDKLQQEQQRNGRSRLLPKSWSPQHMAPYSPPQPAHDVNDTLSSSDTSDEEA